MTKYLFLICLLYSGSSFSEYSTDFNIQTITRLKQTLAKLESELVANNISKTLLYSQKKLAQAHLNYFLKAQESPK